jgi:hypothetical protein
MGMDLEPVIGDEWHSFNTQGWTSLLGLVGPIIGHRPMIGGRCVVEPREVTWEADPENEIEAGSVMAHPTTNDGYPVTAEEAKAMALYARGYASAERYKLEQQCSDEDERWLQKLERFADWAEQSGGFAVH